MTSNPDFLFHQTPEQLRRIGARGGRACARNRRARLCPVAPQPQATPSAPPPVEFTAAAIVALDAQLPWLCGAEKRLSLRNP